MRALTVVAPILGTLACSAGGGVPGPDASRTDALDARTDAVDRTTHEAEASVDASVDTRLDAPVEAALDSQLEASEPVDDVMDVPIVEIDTAPAPTNGAQFVSQTVPSRVDVGSMFSIQVTMQNSGTTTWSAAAPHRRRTTLWRAMRST